MGAGSCWAVGSVAASWQSWPWGISTRSQDLPGFILPEVMQAKQLLEALSQTCSSVLPLQRKVGRPASQQVPAVVDAVICEGSGRACGGWTSLGPGSSASCPRDAWVPVPREGFLSAEKKPPLILLWKVPQLPRLVFTPCLIPFGPSCTKTCLELAVGAQRWG